MSMSYIEKAIREAMEKGGYRHMHDGLDATEWVFDKYEGCATEEILLDHHFWQALGRARGWDRRDKNHDPVWQVTYNVEEHTVLDLWLNMMLDFTYHLASGRTAEDFFAELLGGYEGV